MTTDSFNYPQQDTPDESGTETNESDNFSTEELEQPEGTAQELFACAMAYKVRNNHSDREFFRLVRMLRNFFPTCNKLPRSLYLTKQELDKMCTLTTTFVVFCPHCRIVVNRSLTYQTEAECRVCHAVLNDRLVQGSCQFATLSIKEQIVQYTKNRTFQKIVRKFRNMTGSHMNGLLHQGLIAEGHFDLTFCIDAAQMHNKPGRACAPALLVFNNVPINLQLRFPIMAAVCVGTKSDEPPRNCFLEEMARELRELGDTTTVTWKNDKGITIISHVYMPTVITDHLEKIAMMSHCHHNMRWACPFCEIVGKILNNENSPHIFLNNPMRKTTGDKVGGGHRFIAASDGSTYRRRGSQERLTVGIEVLETQNRTKDFKFHRKGITGLPPLMTIPRFHETSSHVSDTLHTFLHGILKDVLKTMMKGHGKRHSFAENSARDFSFYKSLQDTMTKITESDRNCSPLKNFSSWTAYDELQFCLHNVALFCSDEVYMDKNVYAILSKMANVLYLSHYGRMTDEIIDQVKKEMADLKKLFKPKFTEEYFTIKWHIWTEHLIDFLVNHGNASLFDGFNMERFNLHTKNTVTALHLELRQLVRNFQLKYHSHILDQMRRFGDAATKALQEMGFTHEFTPTFSDCVKKEDRDQAIPDHILDAVFPILVENRLCEETDEIEDITGILRRLTVMTRKGVIFETSRNKHRVKSRVKDSYIKVHESVFGEIQEIIGVRKDHHSKINKFIFVLREFKTRTILDDTGEVRQYPLNQFPYEDTGATGIPEYYAFILRENTFIQKCQLSVSNVKEFGQKVNLISMYPNEWFRM
jgi:hypothetical protein